MCLNISPFYNLMTLMSNKYKYFFLLLLVLVHTQVINTNQITSSESKKLPTTASSPQTAKKVQSKLFHLKDELKGVKAKTQNDIESAIHKTGIVVPPELGKKISALNIKTIQEQAKNIVSQNSSKNAQNANNSTSKDSKTKSTTYINQKLINNISAEIQAHRNQVQKIRKELMKESANHLKSLNQSNSSTLRNISNLRKKHDHPKAQGKNEAHKSSNQTQNANAVNQKSPHYKKWIKNAPKIFANAHKSNISCKDDKQCIHKFHQTVKLGANVKCDLKSNKCYVG